MSILFLGACGEGENVIIREYMSLTRAVVSPGAMLAERFLLIAGLGFTAVGFAAIDCLRRGGMLLATVGGLEVGYCGWS